MLTLTMRPPRKYPHRNTSSYAKTVSIDAKLWSPEAGKKFYKKN